MSRFGGFPAREKASVRHATISSKKNLESELSSRWENPPWSGFTACWSGGPARTPKGCCQRWGQWHAQWRWPPPAVMAIHARIVIEQAGTEGVYLSEEGVRVVFCGAVDYLNVAQVSQLHTAHSPLLTAQQITHRPTVAGLPPPQTARLLHDITSCGVASTHLPLTCPPQHLSRTLCTIAAPTSSESSASPTARSAAPANSRARAA